LGYEENVLEYNKGEKVHNFAFSSPTLMMSLP